MSKLKLFLENFIIYGLGGIISKIIPLIMVPIVTRIMPGTEYFGISDLSNTLVQFGSAVAIMGMYDAMYRMFFEKEEESYKKKVCSTAIMFTLATSAVVFLIMVIGKDVIARYFFNDKQYVNVVYLSAMATLVGATNSIVSAPVRMQNKRKVFLITNIVSPVISYSISIPMIKAGYYVIALPLAAVISGVTMELTFALMNRKWFNPLFFDKKLLKELLILAIPLMPGVLIYWIFNSCDKIMITNILGVGAAGVYSVGSKLGHCSQLIYTAFAGGWQFFAFSTMKDNDQVRGNSKIFEYLGVISFVVTFFVCAWSYLIFKFIFTEQYLSGYIVAPYLFLAPLLQMLFQVASNQFLIIKKTWFNLIILSVGAVFNILLNWALIPLIGIEGAAIATLVGYIVSDVLCVVVLCRMKLMVMSRRFIAVTSFMTVYIIVWRVFFSDDFIIGTLLAIVASLACFYIYRDDLRKMWTMIRRRKTVANV